MAWVCLNHFSTQIHTVFKDAESRWFLWVRVKAIELVAEQSLLIGEASLDFLDCNNGNHTEALCMHSKVAMLHL